MNNKRSEIIVYGSRQFCPNYDLQRLYQIGVTMRRKTERKIGGSGMAQENYSATPERLLRIFRTKNLCEPQDFRIVGLNA
jgi:hypothetical protein